MNKRIEINEAWRFENENTEFVLEINDEFNLEEAIDAMISALQEDRVSSLDYKDIWVQDLEDCKMDKSIEMQSVLSSYDFERYIPAMIKRIAEVMPEGSFKGHACYDDLNCYYVDEYDFEYSNGLLTIVREFKDDTMGYFCPECGYQVALCGEEFGDRITCDDCEEEFSKTDLEYIAPEITEESFKMISGKLEKM